MNMKLLASMFLFLFCVQGLRVVNFDDKKEQEYSLEAYCESVYLDIGSNRGVQVRKLFEPGSYPNAKVLGVFDRYFGSAELRSKPSSESGICAIGFEANPDLAEGPLRDIEQNHQGHGWNTKFFAPRVVANDDTSAMTFYIDGRASVGHLGSGVTKAQAERSSWGEGEVREVSVPSIDITNFIKSVVVNEKRKTVVAKMDIEGSEYIVLPKLMQAGLLCAGKIDAMFLEWHKLIPPGYEQGQPDKKRLSAKLKAEIASAQHCGGAKPTKLMDIDDETYLEDGVPFTL